MSDEPVKKKFDVIEIAKKKRHAHLLEKLQKSSLTAAELEELKRFERSDLPAGVVEFQEGVARTFGVTERTIRSWIQQGMPVREGGGYDLAEIYRWKLEKDGESEVNPKHHWETRFRQYKALLAEIDYRKALGELVTKDEMEQGRVQRILIIKKALLGLPARLAPQVVNLEIKKAEEIIRIRIEEIISDFARGGDGSGSVQSDNADVVGS